MTWPQWLALVLIIAGIALTEIVARLEDRK